LLVSCFTAWLLRWTCNFSLWLRLSLSWIHKLCCVSQLLVLLVRSPWGVTSSFRRKRCCNYIERSLEITWDSCRDKKMKKP
jgi:hypothetical protein